MKKQSIYGCILPTGDYSDYVFEDIDIRGVKLTYNSKLPNNPNLFQQVRQKSIRGVTLPKMDFS